MFNEFELLQFQVKEELKSFSNDAPVMVFTNEETGHYIDHFVDGDYSRTPPNIIQQMTYKLKLFKCTLGELNQAILDEFGSREKVEQG